MRLNDFDVVQFEVPMRGNYASSKHAALSTMESVLVTLETADGARGIATADPSPGYSRQTPGDVAAEVERALPAVLDDPPTHLNGLRDRLDGVEGVGPNTAFAVETAFLDLYGREHGLGVADLFGGTDREEEPLNAWVGIDDPGAMADEAAEWLDRGFTSCKLKLSGDLEADVARLRRVTERVGDRMAVRADVNGGYDDVEAAIELAQSAEPLGLAHLEQPVPQGNLDGLARLTESTSTTIMADEPVTDLDALFEILRRGAADRVKLKTLRLGGLRACQAAIDVAAAAGVQPVVGHGFCLSPAAAAELALVAANDAVFRPVETVGPLKMAEEPFEPALSMEDGTVRLPDGPGIGVRLDDDALEQFR
ncbi:MAG: mandelate racemase/muconate lactonizing enzyme family protein [Haloferacaceae archaeon]